MRVEVAAEDPVTGGPEKTTTVGALDDEGAPAAVPDLVCPPGAERDRRAGGAGDTVEALVARMERE